MSVKRFILKLMIIIIVCFSLNVNAESKINIINSNNIILISVKDNINKTCALSLKEDGYTIKEFYFYLDEDNENIIFRYTDECIRIANDRYFYDFFPERLNFKNFIFDEKYVNGKIVRICTINDIYEFYLELR